VEGVVYDRGGVRAILNPSKRIGYQYCCDKGIVMFVIEGGPGLMVGSDATTFSGLTPAVLPPLAASELMQHALIHECDIIPVLNIHALISVDPKYRKKKYTPRSRFHQLFGTREVRVLEFSLSDMVLGLPDSQVEDIVDVVSFRTLRETHPLLLGVAELKGDLLPVLSLSPCFGRPARSGSDSKMIMMKNGNFRVLLLAEKVMNRRSLLPDEQKGLPLKLPHRYVYGCYTDENSVRLILDVATIAMYAGEGKVSDDLKTLMEKFVPCVPREEKEPVAISNGITGMDNKKTIDHSEADLLIREEINIDNSRLNEKEEQVFTPPLLAAASTAQELKGDIEGPTGATHDDLLEYPPVTSSEGNNSFGEHSEFAKADGHKKTSGIDVFERTDTGKQVTVPDATNDRMDKGPVNEERRMEKRPARSPETPDQSDKDVTGLGTSGDNVETVESESGSCVTEGMKGTAMTGRDYDKELKIGEGISTGSLEGRTGDEKKEKEGSCVLFDTRSVRNIDHDDVPERMLPERNGSLENIEEAVPDKSCNEMDLPYAGHRKEKSCTERRKRGFHAFLALGIVAVVMVFFGYLFFAPGLPDLTVISEIGRAKDGAMEETTPDVNKSAAVFSAMNIVYPDQKKIPEAFEKVPMGSVPDKRITASEQPAFVNNDKTMVIETSGGNIAVISGSSSIDKTKAYVVKRGDTLWDIAEHFTGNPFDYNTIAADNEIKNPDLIFPGQKIVIHIKVSDERTRHTDASP
jgi:chemotaxis signal transduction protein/LysM repeat protein